MTIHYCSGLGGQMSPQKRVIELTNLETPMVKLEEECARLPARTETQSTQSTQSFAAHDEKGRGSTQANKMLGTSWRETKERLDADGIMQRLCLKGHREFCLRHTIENHTITATAAYDDGDDNPVRDKESGLRF